MKYGKIFWFVGGAMAGAVVLQVCHIEPATGQSTLRSGPWQVSASSGYATAWRINTATGELDYCSVTGEPICKRVPTQAH